MPSKYTWTTPDGLTRYGGPRTGETDAQEKAVDKEIGKLVPNNGTPVYQAPTTGALVGVGGEVIPVLGRQLILNGASAGTDSGWQRISSSPERLVYQLTSGSVSTGFAVDISADGVTSLGQAFTGTWARSDLAFITGLISFSNPLAKYLRVTVTSGGPISMARGA